VQFYQTIGNYLLKYLIRRFCQTMISLLAVATITFILMKVIPGDPFQQEQTISPEILECMHKHYGLDKPVLEQYASYIKKVFTCDLGPSFKYEGRTVNDVIKDCLPLSITLGSIALAIALIFGITLGSLRVYVKNKILRRAIFVIIVISMSIPSFLKATLLQYFFAVKFEIFPIARYHSLYHLVLPAISLAAFPTSFIAKLMSANLQKILEKDYITLAKAKGLTTWQIYKNHALKNSILPIVSYIGLVFASIITGSFIIEKIYGLPGLGGWVVSSIMNRDYTMTMGLTIFYSTVLMLASLVTDLLYRYFDPRIRLEQS
jgi:oligopeptide transport system permease protein